MDLQESSTIARLMRLIVRAADASGKSHSEIARLSGVHRNVLRRMLAGDRIPNLQEALSILDAMGLPGEEALILLMVGSEDLVIEHAGSNSAAFVRELFRRAPAEIYAELGDDVDELRPRWANGAAKLLARTLRQHVVDLNRRGEALDQHARHL